MLSSPMALAPCPCLMMENKAGGPWCQTRGLWAKRGPLQFVIWPVPTICVCN